MTNEVKLSIQKLLEDELFRNKLQRIDTVEEYQTIFQEHGIELSLEELYLACNEIVSENEKPGELNETDLDTVAGGSIIATIIRSLKGGGKGAFGGGGGGTR